jgi:Protein of unknown function (DUF1186)/SEC-C motif
MTPDQILAAFAVQEGLPREAMAEAGTRRDEMIPVFLEQIDRLRRMDVDTVDEADRSAFLFVYYLLGEWRDARVYRPLAALLRRDPDFVDSLIGDAITEDTARVIAGVCDGDLQPIFEVIEDPAADEFVRCGMIDALVLIARHRPETRPEVTGYLERFFASDIEKPAILWSAWAFAVADLGLEHLEPQVRQSFEQEWISPDEADLDFFQEQLRRAVESGESPWFHRSRESRLIENAIEELSGWYCFSDKYRKDIAKERASAGSLSGVFSDTFERDMPKVGRNDPCPCGSGKKFKKCCLQ